MNCSISKWFISNASDQKRPLPKFIQNHLNHCRSCREFHRLTKELDISAPLEAQALLQNTPGSLLTKMNPAEADFAGQENMTSVKRRLIPILSVSASLVAATLIVILVLLPSQQAPTPLSIDNSAFLFSRDSLPGGTLQELAKQANTPFNEEWFRLRKALQSASRYLTGQLNLKIDPPLRQ